MTKSITTLALFSVLVLQSFSGTFSDIIKDKSPDLYKISQSINNKNNKTEDGAYLVDNVNVYNSKNIDLYDTYAYIYNENNQILSEDAQSWDGDTWVSISRSSNTYDSGFNLTKYFKEEWDNEEWNNSERETNTYDSAQNQLSKYTEEWNWKDEVWENISFVTNSSFTDGGNPKMAIKQNWDLENGQWVNGSKSEMTYNSDGNPLVLTLQQWNSGAWTNAYIITITYNSEGNPTSQLFQVWLGTWTNWARMTSTYDSEGNLLTEIIESWTSNVWVNAGMSTYTYDANGNELTQIKENWGDGVWVKDTKENSIYDANDNVTTIFFQDWDSEYSDWVNAVNNSSFEDSNGQEFGSFEGYKLEINWTFVKSAKEIPEDIFDINIFPNPAQNMTTVKYNLEQNGQVEISITDLNGAKINVLNQGLQTIGSHEIQLGTENMLSGSYFITVSQNGIYSIKSVNIVR